MDHKLLAKVILILGAICILGSFGLAYLIFAMKERLGNIPYLFASLLLGIGIVLLVFAKKTYVR